MTTTVLLGAKTRLGRALLVRLAGSEPVLLVARDAADAATLADLARESRAAADGDAGRAPVEVATPGTLTERVAALAGTRGSADEEAGDLRVVVAALGPVHPTGDGEPLGFEADLDAVRRDLALVDEVLAVQAPTQVVLVSSVLALAPGRGRRYYGGWKALLEQLLEERVRASRTAVLAVLYPGRLRPAGRLRRPWHRLHTSYPALADAVLGLDPTTPVGRTVGADARFWLGVRSISFALASLGLTTSRDRTSTGGP